MNAYAATRDLASPHDATFDRPFTCTVVLGSQVLPGVS
jgi:hypothetical protein